MLDEASWLPLLVPLLLLVTALDADLLFLVFTDMLLMVAAVDISFDVCQRICDVMCDVLYR